MFTYTPRRSVWSPLLVAAAPLTIVLVTASLAVLFHIRGQSVAEQQLRERLLSTVSIAALDINPDQVKRVRTVKDMKTASYASLVHTLHSVRELSPGTRFAYIMRKTADPMTVAFVADADGLSSLKELDANGNGVVDPDEAPGLPGDSYNISDSPALQGDAFVHPTVEDHFTVDQWGQLLSAFAPIKDANGKVIAVLGIDMEAGEFLQTISTTFSLLSVILVIFVGILLAVYILMIIRSRHLESLRQLDTERTALLDLATHQLGMPLATFRWWLEILREKDNGKFCARDGVCDQLQEGIDRMDSIIRGLQEAGRLREDAVSDKTSRASVPTVAKSVLAALDKTLKMRKQKVTTSFPSRLPSVRLDRQLCEGLLRELLENASAYSPEKSHVEIVAKVVRTNLEISVIDHGHGIPEQDIPHIFEQFRRGSNASKYKPAGNGLGLFIVRRIVERARGKIRIASVLEKGTTVTVLLPIAS